MKKSELRYIIREEIQKIVTEKGLAWPKSKSFIWKFWFESDPREIKDYVKNASDDVIIKLAKYPLGHKTGKGSPQDLQRRLLDKEIKRRGLKQ